jgi:hypothetical protein
MGARLQVYYGCVKAIDVLKSQRGNNDDQNQFHGCF